jgi:hypothetical protein
VIPVGAGSLPIANAPDRSNVAIYRLKQKTRSRKRHARERLSHK